MSEYSGFNDIKSKNHHKVIFSRHLVFCNLLTELYEVFMVNLSLDFPSFLFYILYLIR